MPCGQKWSKWGANCDSWSEQKNRRSKGGKSWMFICYVSLPEGKSFWNSPWGIEKLGTSHNITRWWFQIFSTFTPYFSDGLKPPTSKRGSETWLPSEGNGTCIGENQWKIAVHHILKKRSKSCNELTLMLPTCVILKNYFLTSKNSNVQ